MSDEEQTTNLRIVDLLLTQTYAERFEMAEWFRDALNDLLDYNKKDFTSDDVALLFENWADGLLDEEASQP